MSKLEDKYAGFKKNIESVVLFMDFIDGQKKETKEEDEKAFIEKVIHSSVPYNATIISLYGNIELFVDEITEVYIDEVYKIVHDYSELPKKMRDKHEMMSGEFLANPNRFNNYGISSIDLIRNLNDCLQGVPNALINKKMILRHGGNLKSEQIFQFLSEIGVDNAKNTFLENDTFVEYYASCKEFTKEDAKERLLAIRKESNSLNAIFDELDNLVEQRNQVAHSGKVDEKKSFEYIKNTTIPFLKVFAEVLADILINELVALSFKKNMCNLLDIKDVFNNEVIWLRDSNNALKVGDRIACTNGSQVGWRTITSIRVGDIAQSKVENGEIKDVTIKVDKKVKKNWTFFLCEILG